MSEREERQAALKLLLRARAARFGRRESVLPWADALGERLEEASCGSCLGMRRAGDRQLWRRHPYKCPSASAGHAASYC